MSKAFSAYRMLPIETPQEAKNNQGEEASGEAALVLTGPYNEIKDDSIPAGFVTSEASPSRLNRSLRSFGKEESKQSKVSPARDGESKTGSPVPHRNVMVLVSEESQNEEEPPPRLQEKKIKQTSGLFGAFSMTRSKKSGNHLDFTGLHGSFRGGPLSSSQKNLNKSVDQTMSNDQSVDLLNSEEGGTISDSSEQSSDEEAEESGDKGEGQNHLLPPVPRGPRERRPSQFQGAEIFTVKRKPKEVPFGQKLIIPASGAFYAWWKILLMLVSFASSTVYVNHAAFFENEVASDSFQVADLCFSCFYLVDLLLHFLVDELKDSQDEQVDPRTPKAVAFDYLAGDFAIDLLTILPLSRMYLVLGSDDFTSRMLYLVKILRLFKAFRILHYRNITSYFKDWQKRRIKWILQHKVRRAHSQEEDQTQMSAIMLISKIVKAVQLIVVLLCLSYFTGMAWYIKCQIVRDEDTEVNFILEYELDSSSDGYVSVALTYFMFTSLSTVGLGDYTPKSNLERLIGAFILLFGVLITSVIMDNFSTMIDEIRNFHNQYDDSNELNLFLGTIKRFNKNTSLPPKIQERFELYFHHRWDNHKGLAIVNKDDQSLYDLLPDATQRMIFTEFLFRSFLETYERLFKAQSVLQRLELLWTKIPSRIGESKPPVRDPIHWDDERYKIFIVQLLQVLEPKIFFRKIIQKQNALVDEIVFITEGYFQVGYNTALFFLKQMKGNDDMTEEQQEQLKNDLLQSKKRMSTKESKKVMFPLTCKAGQPTGLYEVCFEERSQFIYRVREQTVNGVQRQAKCFFIRKRNWRRLMKQSDNLKEIVEHFKNSVLLDYVDKIYLPLKQHMDKLWEKERLRSKNKAAKLKNLMKLMGAGNFQSEVSVKKQQTANSRQEDDPFKSEASGVTSALESAFSDSASATRSISQSAVSVPPMDRDILLENIHRQEFCRLDRKRMKKARQGLVYNNKKTPSLHLLIKSLPIKMEATTSILHCLISKGEAATVLLTAEKDVVEEQKDLIRRLEGEIEVLKHQVSHNFCEACHNKLDRQVANVQMARQGTIHSHRHVTSTALQLEHSASPLKNAVTSRFEKPEVEKQSSVNLDQIDLNLIAVEASPHWDDQNDNNIDISPAKSSVNELSYIETNLERSVHPAQEDTSPRQATVPIENRIATKMTGVSLKVIEESIPAETPKALNFEEPRNDNLMLTAPSPAPEPESEQPLIGFSGAPLVPPVAKKKTNFYKPNAFLSNSRLTLASRKKKLSTMLVGSDILSKQSGSINDAGGSRIFSNLKMALQLQVQACQFEVIGKAKEEPPQKALKAKESLSMAVPVSIEIVTRRIVPPIQNRSLTPETVIPDAASILKTPLTPSSEEGKRQFRDNGADNLDIRESDDSIQEDINYGNNTISSNKPNPMAGPFSEVNTPPRFSKFRQDDNLDGHNSTTERRELHDLYLRGQKKMRSALEDVVVHSELRAEEEIRESIVEGSEVKGGSSCLSIRQGDNMIE